MNVQKQSTTLDSVFLSDIELYYTSPENISNGEVLIYDEECYHITRVMRHNVNDELFVTDGAGKIYKCLLSNIGKDLVKAEVSSVFNYNVPFPDFYFCIPKLKSTDRFEFALEKCVELGVTNFIVYDARRSITKSGKIDRWNKILLSAMKQSLRSYLSEIQLYNTLEDITKLDGNKIIFEQNAQNSFKDFNPSPGKKYYFIFGPEGGLDKSELNLFQPESYYKLTSNRLRSETAIVTVSAYLNSIFIVLMIVIQ
jgi:16S rRNA (uracil1498-N3)-methyltransferase